MNILLGSAAEVDGLDNNGISPLNDAAFYGHTSIVNYLIENSSANVNLVDQSGWSALHRAASNGHSETCAMLIQLGAKKNLHHIRGEVSKKC